MTSCEVNLDINRSERIGFDEAILCADKSARQIRQIVEEAAQRSMSLLLTRLDPAVLSTLPKELRERVDYDLVSRTGFFDRLADPQSPTVVAVLSAGTSDVPVAREAVRTLAYYGETCSEIYDVGVAGLWRLTDRLPEIRSFPVLIVAAGMDAALASVVGGLVASVVIVVPTPTGYGVAANGEAALRSALASCAPGVVVVNIGNGYGAACAALRILGVGRVLATVGAKGLGTMPQFATAQ